MRYVERGIGPAILVDNGKRGKKELVRARERFGTNVQATSSFRFNVYRDETVKVALEELFFGKCAYCESRYWAMAPVDVEHFRPKGAVAEDAAHRGYWWLASSWENLLPSCIDCNRRRGHTLPEVPTSLTSMFKSGLDSTSSLLMGKGSCFPISGRRAYGEDDNLGLEKPLLLNPTKDREIGQHLTYYINRSKPLGLVLPKYINGAPSERGLNTIFTFGLNRLRLVQERTIILNKLEFLAFQIEKCLDLVDDLEELDSPVASKATRRISVLIESTKKEIRNMASPSQPYSSLVLAWRDALRSDV